MLEILKAILYGIVGGDHRVAAHQLHRSFDPPEGVAPPVCHR